MRLIDADELKTRKSINSANFNTIETIQEWIDNAPTIDLVRCGECKHWYRNNPPIDEECDMLPNADDFCPYGERKSE